MKKFSATLGMLAFCSLMMNGQAVTNETTNATYATLTEAWKAAANNDVLVLNQDVEVTERLGGEGRQFTLKGNGHKITRAASYSNGLMFLTNKDTGNVTLENVTIDGANIEIPSNVLESSNNSKLNLNNVTIINCKSTNEQGVISIKGGGFLNVTNTVIKDCVVPEQFGYIFVGDNNVTFSGDCTTTVFVEAANHLNCENLTAGKLTLEFLLPGAPAYSRNMDASIVNGTENIALFESAKTAYELTANNGNIYLKEKDADISYAVYNQSKDAGYMSLVDAWKAAGNNDVLILNQNAAISERLNADGRTIILRGKTADATRAEAEKVTLTRADNYGNGLLFLVNQGNDNAGKITIENIDMDCTGFSGDACFFESTDWGTLTLKNVNIKHCTTTNEQGVISVKNGGGLVLEDVNISDCEIPAGYGYVFAGTDAVSLKGTVNTSIFVEGNHYFTATDLTGGLITICFNESAPYARDFTAPIVKGNTNSALFKSNNPNYDLKLDENDFSLEKNEISSVVEGIDADEAQIVDVYSIQGVRLKAGVAAAEATEGLPAGLYIVGGKKVIVR